MQPTASVKLRDVQRVKLRDKSFHRGRPSLSIGPLQTSTNILAFADIFLISTTRNHPVRHRVSTLTWASAGSFQFVSNHAHSRLLMSPKRLSFVNKDVYIYLPVAYLFSFEIMRLLRAEAPIVGVLSSWPSWTTR